jgi:RNA polymerase sigma factor (sigma-70 family)
MVHGQLSTVLRHLQKVMGAGNLDDLPDGRLLELFAAGHTEAAFAALVRRHGPLVLGVCRRLLHNTHDAEDAFQATFLILFRRARSLDRRGSVANWLYTVAYHVALRARANAARRQRRERPVHDLPQTEGRAEEVWWDLQPVLDEELQRLPEKYRAPVVLCYFQGKTNEEAAQQLGCPLGTVKSRLARARDLLGTRLARRGVTLSAGLLGAGLAQPAPAAVPAALVEATVRTALLWAAGKTVAGLASASAVVLAEGVLKTLIAAKLKIATTLVLAVGLAVLGAGTLTRQALAQRQGAVPAPAVQPAAQPKERPQPAPAADQAAVQPPRPEPQQEMTLTGRVLAPDGKPVPGADVALVVWPHQQPQEGHVVPRPEAWGQAQADGEGRFRFTVRWSLPPRFYATRMYGAAVMASARGYGLGWHFLRFDFEKSVPFVFPPDTPVQLQPEQVLRGRLIDLQGQPVAGAQLEVVRLGKKAPRYGGFGTAEGDEAIRTYAGTLPFGQGGRIQLWDQEIWFREAPERLPLWPGPATTDAEGRFTLRGLPSNTEGVGLHVGGNERVAFQELTVPPQAEGQPAEVTLSAAAALLIEGTVTDAETGRPLPGARVHIDVAGGGFSGNFSTPADWKGRRGLTGQGYAPFSWPTTSSPAVRGQTDDKGRFRLRPFLSREFVLTVSAPDGQPYLGMKKTLTWPRGAVQQELPVALPRGVFVRGKVTEAGSGNPVAQARVDFWSKDFKSASDTFSRKAEGVLRPAPGKTDAAGQVQMIVPHGRAHLLINGPTPEYLLKRIAAEELGVAQTRLPPMREHDEKHYYPDEWLALDLPAGAEPVQPVVALRRAPLLKGRVLNPDGQPAAQVRLFQGQAPFAELTHGYFAHKYEVRAGAFELPFRNPDSPLHLLFLDAANGRGAVAAFTDRQAGGAPVTVRLAPCGVATARFLDAQGNPLADYRPLLCLSLPAQAYSSPKDLERLASPREGYDAVWVANVDPQHYGDGPRTDAQGRITFPALVPGATYRIVLFDGTAKDFRVEEGQTVELGDLTIKEPGKTAKLPTVKPSE